jgi:ketosteroid isomerase-like protein
MSQQNVEAVRTAFEAYNRGDLDTAVADFAPDCEYISTGALPGFRGVSRGPEGYKEFVGWLREEFDDARIDVDELVEAGDRVLASITLCGRGRRSGVATTWSMWQVWTLRGGKFVRGQGFTNKGEALEAAGLEE